MSIDALENLLFDLRHLPPLLTAAEVGEVLDCSGRTVQRLTKVRELGYVQTGTGRMCTHLQVAEFILSRQVPPFAAVAGPTAGGQVVDVAVVEKARVIPAPRRRSAKGVEVGL